MDLNVPYRCKDESFGRILNGIRTAKPTAEQLRAFYKRKAWTPPGLPTADGIRKLFTQHPETIILSITRRGAKLVNDCALEALFPHFPLRAIF